MEKNNLDLTYVARRNSKGQFVSRKYGTDLNKIVDSWTTDLSESVLNKAIRKYNSIVSKRLARLENSDLVEFSAGRRALIDKLGLDPHNVKLPSATSMTSTREKLNYLGVLSTVIDNPTLTNTGARNNMNTIRGLIGGTKNMTNSQVADLWVKLLDLKDYASSYTKLSDIIDEYNNEIEEIKNAMIENSENVTEMWTQLKIKIKTDALQPLQSLEQNLNSIL